MRSAITGLPVVLVRFLCRLLRRLVRFAGFAVLTAILLLVLDAMLLGDKRRDRPPRV